MACKKIAIANMKGGVGKTTSVVCLAEALAADSGARVLIIDLDPQSSASICLAGDELLAKLIHEGSSLEAYLALRLIQRAPTSVAKRIRESVSATTFGGQPLAIDLLPSGPHLRLIEKEILYSLTQHGASLDGIDEQITELFKSEVLPAAKKYDYLIFDCAPGISPVNEAAIRLSDMVIVPTNAERLSTYGLNAFCQTVWRAPGFGGRRRGARRLPFVLVTRWKQGVVQQNEVLKQLQVEAGASDPYCRLLETKIPEAAALSNALTRPDYFPTYHQKYKGLLEHVFDPLISEVKEALHGA